ncbi:MAG: NHL repeat-containing protein [Candidatus Coatesbacteria bacterium]|nr:MAG: NHL repeat-containing protein [Candidatus Coatesbacteria bacterium]
MKRTVLFLAAAATVSTVLAGFKYEGEWRCDSGDLLGVDVAPNGNVYTNEGPSGTSGGVVKYFTPTGSLLGSWPDSQAGVAVAPNGNVYTGGCNSYPIRYYTPTGSLLGSWNPPNYVWGGDVAANGNVFICGAPIADGNPGNVYICTPTGSLLGSWPCRSGDVEVSRNNVVYVVDRGEGVVYYNTAGTRLGHINSKGCEGVAVAPNGDVFLTNRNHYVERFAGSGSFIEAWGQRGSGPGEFEFPSGIAVSPTGERVYVADSGNDRIQYFNRNEPAVTPTSLGCVKALFR